jgi:tRNA uridine 5-carboxymethylaminomethyl modification enzyme
MSERFDIVVIGGGHAGAEAAWIASRMGCAVAMVTLDPQRIGQMSCNPAIGGQAKGQMVREIDALGGLMGLATDATAIQFRMLNRSKGPAVWGPRAQADKYRYAKEVQRLLGTCRNLTVVAGEVAEVETCQEKTQRRRISAVRLADGRRLSCEAVIVTTGTFLRALMHTGPTQTAGGRVGEASAGALSACLARLGLELGRLKTGTPPRLHRDSIDFSAFAVQMGDAEPAPFSYLNEYGMGEHGGAFVPPMKQVNCWIGATTPAVHELIRANVHRAPMYSGQIKSSGPRYCPSIEDKVVRFAQREQHHIFFEPESLDTPEIYCNGISTSLPSDVQEQMIRLIAGLKDAKVLRWGYAVEYDMVWPTQIDSTLQTKTVGGLFLAGQINGTSGYEEAAAQGLLAGINAARLVKSGSADFVLRRDQAYAGVMVDDLVTRPPIEPYRMFTSRAEHRLHLRADNADERLTPLGREIGTVDDERWEAFCECRDAVDAACATLAVMRIDGVSAVDWLRRPENSWETLMRKTPHPTLCRHGDSSTPGTGRGEKGGRALRLASLAQGRRVEIKVKYQPFIERQERQIQRMVTLENHLIPGWLDYGAVTGLRTEARQKLGMFNPRSIGQASRISGITPADLTLLAVHIQRGRR